jgi:acyl dehydratase
VPLTIHVRDLAGLGRRHLGYSDWHEITQRRIDLFAEATGDQQWIHVDPGRAAAGPYGGTIAHGFFTLALAPVLLAEIMRFDGVDIMVNRGLTEVHLRAPVPVGARIRMGAELLSVRPRPRDYVETTVRLTFDSEVDERRQSVAVAELVVLLHAQPSTTDVQAGSHQRRETG